MTPGETIRWRWRRRWRWWIVLAPLSPSHSLFVGRRRQRIGDLTIHRRRRIPTDRSAHAAGDGGYVLVLVGRRGPHAAFWQWQSKARLFGPCSAVCHNLKRSTPKTEAFTARDRSTSSKRGSRAFLTRQLSPTVRFYEHCWSLLIATRLG